MKIIRHCCDDLDSFGGLCRVGSGVGLASDNFGFSIRQIHYCPFCGKKIEFEEVKE